MTHKNSPLELALKTTGRVILGPSLYETIQFYRHLGYWPRLRNPRSFNEKVVHRKLWAVPPLAAKLTDKVAVRDYVRDRVGDKYLSQIFLVTEDPRDIHLKDLPDRFVLKCSNGNGNDSLLLVDDKTKHSETALRQRAEQFLNRFQRLTNRFYWYSNQTWYAEISPRLMIEEFLVDHQLQPPPDYKLFVFHGKAQFIQVDQDRFSNHTRNLYDRQWKKLNLRITHSNGPDVPPPSELDELLAVAEQLATGFDFLRVDLYQLANKRIVFGELTFAPGAGQHRFYPREMDFHWGSLW